MAGEERNSGEELFYKGTVSRITFKNEGTGFGVLRADPAPGERTRGETTVVGSFPPTLVPGASFIARGEWQTHPRFGSQFKARSITETEPTGTDAILRYLSGGAVKGFGPVLASRVVEHFGESTLSVIENTPDRLLEVSGIGKQKLEEIKAAWLEKTSLREVTLFFQNYDISLSTAQRIYTVYKDRAIEIVRANPYILIRDVPGIGFQTADKIALLLGIEKSSPQRLSAGLQYTLKRASDDGHCFLSLEVLVSKAGTLLEVGDEGKTAEAAEMLVAEGAITKSRERYYLPPLFLAEQTLAQSLASRIKSSPPPLLPEIIKEISERAIVTTPDKDGNPRVLRLSEEQRTAIELAAKHSVVVITGGPGCGKTTVTRAVASLFLESGLTLKLAAPTGRAAQRLSEVCGVEASTIHRLLKFEPHRRSFFHNEENLLELDAIIIDESSMIDLPLAAALFQAIPESARVVIVGDADQLPSVGPGLFLSDLLSVPALPRVLLKSLFRRANESLITTIAHQINLGEIPEIPTPSGERREAYFLPQSEPREIAQTVEQLVCETIPKKFNYSPAEITVLTPMNKGEIGVVALNQRLQKRLLAGSVEEATARVGELHLHIGDRICQRVNNYSLHSAGVFNGDQGTVIGIDAEANSVRVRLWDGREIDYTGEALYQLDLAYALTIHRSQGSEVPVIVLVLHDSHNILLERQLVYTAVTRAKGLLLVVGTKRALILAVKRNKSRRRFTGLVDEVQRLL